MTKSNGENTGAVKKRKWTFWRLVTVCLIWTWAFLFLGVAAAGLTAFIVYDYVTRPGHKGASVEVVVPSGASGRDIGRLLEEHELIEYEGFFRLALQADRSNHMIKHGAYELYKGLSATELLHLLYEGPSHHLLANQVRVTIPEGLSIPQIAALLGFGEKFIAAAKNPEIIERLDIEADTLEGFLMPNTYFFDEYPEPEVLIERMVSQFEKEYAILLKKHPGSRHLDKRYLLSVASIVERETRADEERPLVAQVIYNRIQRKIPLQMDSTLQFVLNKYGERMLYSDLETASPYNTYMNRGLPPGPICSPGVNSLSAAMAPADVAYLYFVSTGDGRTHTFSKTLKEHNRAVARFRREIAPQRRAVKQTSSP
ncbi:MAG: endolytic transglycosylase MltG [Candidatus Hydrogenedentes bacterium]|nr:endolytic transglycosylase MltG [Candidatus Hydrogenedentota bacterium]